MRAKARSLLALPLLVARVLADHEHLSMATDDLAFLAHLLNGRSDFHAVVPFSVVVVLRSISSPSRRRVFS